MDPWVPKRDLFISCADSELAWVRDCLLPALALAPGQALTHDGFVAGVPLVQQYERAVADSRYTLLILSPAFLADVWAAYANTLSSHLSVNQQRPRLIPLIYAACDLSLGIDALKKLDCTTPQGYTASLADLRALLSQPLDAPPAPPPQAGPSHTGVGDASAFIHEKTRGLVGRDWVCTAVQAFVQDPQRSSGYFVLSGEPGIGKSSIAAELVRRFGWVHHFNRRTVGIVTCATAWRNLAAQLLSRHPLPLRHPPLDRPNDAFDGAYVNDLLTMVSRALPPGQREVIVIDALDEADRTGLPAGANVLLLPSVLPPGLFLIVTLRPDQNDKRRVDTSHLQIEEGRHDFPLYEDDAGNLDDLRGYVAARIASVPVATALAARGIAEADFTGEICVKSEGNFLYARYVCDDVAAGRVFDDLPRGLLGYYAQHWQLICGRDPAAWDASDLPVIYHLAKTRGPVTLKKLARLSARPAWLAQRVLKNIGQFVHQEEIIDDDGERQRTFRLYHDSFRTFVEDQVSAYETSEQIKADHRRGLEREVRRALGMPKRKGGRR